MRDRPRNKLPKGYLPISVLGSGGEAHVILAKDTMLDRWVTLKCLKTGRIHRHFNQIQETIALVANLDHPNINKTITALPYRQGVWLVSNYSQGVSLAQLANAGVDAKWAWHITIALAQGIEALQSTAIIHGDLSPANIIVGIDGSVKITDFGLARRWGDRTASAHTPGFAAPQVRHRQPATPEMDLFSLGACIWFMLTGKAPASLLDDGGGEVNSAFNTTDIDDPCATTLAELSQQLTSADADNRPSLGAVLQLLKKQPPDNLEEAKVTIGQYARQIMPEIDLVSPILAAELKASTQLPAWLDAVIVLGLGAYALSAILLSNVLLPRPVITTPQLDLSLDASLPAEISERWIEKSLATAIDNNHGQWRLFQDQALSANIFCTLANCELALKHTVSNEHHWHQIVLIRHDNIDRWHSGLETLVAEAAIR